MLTPTRCLLSVGMVGALAVGLAGPSHAAKPKPVSLIQGGAQHATVQTHPVSVGVPSKQSPDSQITAGSDTRNTSECMRLGMAVPCHRNGANWSASADCYVQALDPQPGASDPIWDGHRDAEGKPQGEIFQCLSRGGAHFSVPIPGDYVFWAASNPALAGGVDPADLAEEAVKRMHLRAISVGLTPPPAADSYTLVGVPTWMWVDEPDPHTWGPISKSASAGGVTVSATAHVRLVRWDMGDGSTVNCGEGTPYLPAFDADPSPTCGHRYRKPGRYQVSATSDWQVDWAGAGQSGVITFSLHNDAQVWVREAFALVTRNG